MRRFFAQVRFVITDTWQSRKAAVKDPLGSRTSTWNDSGPRSGGIAYTSIHDPAFKNYIKPQKPQTARVVRKPDER